MRKVNDCKALHDLSTEDIYQTFKKKGYKPKSKIFEVERLVSRRKSGSVSTQCFCLFRTNSLCINAVY